MAITTNIVASISHGPAMLIQRLREELSVMKTKGDGTPTVLAACLDKLDQAAVILATFQETEAAIQTNNLLSDEGKRQDMQKTAREFYDRLAFIERAANDRREAARQLREELDTLPKVTTDPLLSYLREAEVRRRLERLTQAERMKYLGDATKPQKTMILTAVEHDPLNPDELIPAEYRARVKEALLEKSRAEDLTRWRTLTVCAEKLTLLGNVLQTVMGKYSLDVPSFSTPPLSKADLKMQDTQQAPPKSKAADKPTTPAFV